MGWVVVRDSKRGGGTHGVGNVWWLCWLLLCIVKKAKVSAEAALLLPALHGAAASRFARLNDDTSEESVVNLAVGPWHGAGRAGTRRLVHGAV